ncbi:MAG: hypothetical protein V5A40_16930 [Haloarculaceae archaeon]
MSLEMRDGIPGVERRTVLKSAAVAAVGAGAFAGVASATDPKQINFCGCSQVCLERGETGGTFDVVLAREEGEGWEFEFVEQPVDEDGGKDFDGDFCYEVGEGSDWKVIAVRPHKKEDCKGSSITLYCNPGRCARNALDAYRDGCDVAECVNDGFGTFDEEEGKGKVEIIHGRCGEPGRDGRVRDDRSRDDRSRDDRGKRGPS